MKKTIITVVISVAATLLLVLGFNLINEWRLDKLVEEVGVKELKEIDYEIPKFTLLTDGIYQTNISTGDFKDVVKTYEIKAVIEDEIEYEYAEYVGVKVKDMLYAYDMEDFKNIIFMSNGGLQVSFKKEEIVDDMFFVFEKNGIKFESGEEVSLLVPGLYERYSISNIVNIHFN